MTTHAKTAKAALATMVILQLVMLGSLYAGVPPHPPVQTPLFGIAPFLAMAVSCAISAVAFGATETPVGRVLTVVAAMLALVSFGPQKYLDPAFALIWPAVLSGQIAVAAAVWAAFRSRSAQMARAASAG